VAQRICPTSGKRCKHLARHQSGEKELRDVKWSGWRLSSRQRTTRCRTNQRQQREQCETTQSISIRGNTASRRYVQSTNVTDRVSTAADGGTNSGTPGAASHSGEPTHSLIRRYPVPTRLGPNRRRLCHRQHGTRAQPQHRAQPCDTIPTTTPTRCREVGHTTEKNNDDKEGR